jgi:riboflavin synthase
MFTGLIEATGTIVSLTPGAEAATRLVIAAPLLAGRWRTGDSIAVNGVCLTALPVQDPHGATADPSHFAAHLAAETLARTTLGSLAPGALVNLELPTPAGSPLGGHVVQGHVDATGTLVSFVPLQPALATTDWRLTLDLPAQLAPQIIPQGSIAIDGISLTVAKLHELHPDGSLRVEIAIIPHTYASTNLHTLTPGSPLNIETDVLARYAAQQAAHASGNHAWLTTGYLLARGY